MQKDELSIESTLALVAEYYKGKTSLGYRTLEEHCRRVASLSQTIATKLFADMKSETFSGDTQSNIEAVAHAGLLHAAINAGSCSFEDIAEHTTVQIADMVANISRDYRLIETKRDMEFRGRVSQSSLATQIVVLADIICTAKEIIDAVAKNGLAAIKRPRKILIRLDADLLALHASSRYYVLRLYAHAAKNMLVDAGQLLKTKKREIKNMKAEARIKQNIAAKRRVVEDGSPALEKRTKKHG